MEPLRQKIAQRSTGLVLYGLVPPKLGTAAERLAAIAARQIKRLEGLPLDGLVLYDLQDESSRIDEERPFPFMEAHDPFAYSRDYLSELAMPKIVYRAVGKCDPAGLREFLQRAERAQALTVFVGAAAREQAVKLSLKQAYQERSQLPNPPLLGGVVIPERHQHGRAEHLRVFEKMRRGCSFFISQGVYDVNAAKNLLSDYHYYGQEHGIALAPIVFTFTPCGSAKTLRFMKWLGISIPPWLENELLHARDILQQSIDISERSYRELSAFAADKNIPIGCNIESVAVRKVEVEASIELLRRLAG